MLLVTSAIARFTGGSVGGSDGLLDLFFHGLFDCISFFVCELALFVLFCVRCLFCFVNFVSFFWWSVSVVRVIASQDGFYNKHTNKLFVFDWWLMQWFIHSV